MVVPPPLVDPNPPSDDSEVELPDVELPGSVTSPQAGCRTRSRFGSGLRGSGVGREVEEDRGCFGGSEGEPWWSRLG